MTAISNRSVDVISKLMPGGALGLAHLSDEALLANTRRLVGKSNELLAALLAHLAEVEARGVHRTRRCSSLYTYCIYELRFSEDAAARRSSAARLVKQFPLLLDAIANGELHLTGLLLIGPHLTPENHVAVLGRAKFRTKKELGKLVRDLNPLPQVPDRIEPLGPTTVRALRNPTWEEYVTSLAPQIRELPLGERPCDWMHDSGLVTTVESIRESPGIVGRAVVVEAVATQSGASAQDSHRTRGTADRATDSDGAKDSERATAAATTDGAERGTESAEESTDGDRLPVGPIPRDLPPVTGPQHYQVQFSTVEEHAQLIERAKALLARSRPGVTLGELHLEAMKLLVASLEKRRFAVTNRQQRHAPGRDIRGEATTPESGTTHESKAVSSPRQRGNETRNHQDGAGAVASLGDEATNADAEWRQRGGETSRRARDILEIEESAEEGGDLVSPPGELGASRRSRYVAAVERREVYRRDDGRCTYVDMRGERCRETRYLELHHLQPFARNGDSVAANLALRCAAHNALAAEEDFGRQLIMARRDSPRHEAFTRQRLVVFEEKD